MMLKDPGSVLVTAGVLRDQDFAVQREALGRAGVNIIFEEKGQRHKARGPHRAAEGAVNSRRWRYALITRLDCLGRSLRDLANIVNEIEQAGAHLQVVEQNDDTSSAAGRAFVGMLAVFAAFETDVRRERRLEGIAMAKRQGIYRGGEARLQSLGSWGLRATRSI